MPHTLPVLFDRIGQAMAAFHAEACKALVAPQGLLRLKASTTHSYGYGDQAVTTAETFETQAPGHATGHARLATTAMDAHLHALWANVAQVGLDFHAALTQELARVAPGWKAHVALAFTMRRDEANTTGHPDNTRTVAALEACSVAFSCAPIGKPDAPALPTASPLAVSPKNPRTPWARAHVRVQRIANLAAPNAHAQAWHVFIPSTARAPNTISEDLRAALINTGLARAPNTSFACSNPQTAQDPHDALLRCALLEWPQLLDRTSLDDVFVTVQKVYRFLTEPESSA